MRILFLADVHPEPNSGAAGTEYQTVRALKRLGCDVEEVWAPDLPHRIRHGNLHYLLELPSGYRNAVACRMARSKYDVIHVNQPAGYRVARYLQYRWPKTVCIHRSHGFELRVKAEVKKWASVYEQELSRKLWRRLASWTISTLLDRHCRSIAQIADGHIVSCTECGDYLSNEMGVSRERLAIVPQAAPEILLQNDIADFSAQRLRRVLYVGQFAYCKAPMVVAEILNQLSDRRSDIEFSWVCASQHHDVARRFLSDGARSRTRFIPWTAQGELKSIYDEHGVFLFPSFFEGFGKAFLEAMSRGLCVVAADNGGMKDVIRHRSDGIKCATGDVAAMIQACLELIENPEFAKSVSAAAVTTARSYTWDGVAQQTAAFYEARLRAKRTNEV